MEPARGGASNSVDAEFWELGANVVDDFLELSVELEGVEGDAVVGVQQADGGLTAAGDDDEVVRCEADDDDLDPALPLHDVDGEDA